MKQFEFFLSQVQDPILRENFKKIIDFLSQSALQQDAFQAAEIYVTANVTGLKIGHKLSSVPKDVIVTRLVAPAAARLVVDYAGFTSEEALFNVTGLASGETLHARVLLGTLQNVVQVGETFTTESPTQQIRSKF